MVIELDLKMKRCDGGNELRLIQELGGMGWMVWGIQVMWRIHLGEEEGTLVFASCSKRGKGR